MTPEAKIKRRIQKIILDNNYDGRIYYYMPVPTGYGKRTVDYLLCVNGVFCAVEAKRPGAEPTCRQQAVLDEVEKAGGKVFVVADDESLVEFDRWIKMTI